MLLNSNDLQAWLGYKQPADVDKWLKKHRIPYLPGKDGLPCTTLDAINARLLGKRASTEIHFGASGGP